MFLRNPRLPGVRILIWRQWLLSELKSDKGEGTGGHIRKLGLLLEGFLPPHGHREALLSGLLHFSCVCLDAFLSSNRLHVCMYNKDDFPLVLSTQLADDISVHCSTYMHAECAGLQICKCSKVQPFMQNTSLPATHFAVQISSDKPIVLQNQTSLLLFK